MFDKHQVQDDKWVSLSLPTQERVGPTRYKRVLIPFTDSLLLEHVFGPTLDMVETMAAEVILLRVRCMPDVVTALTEGESLYSELKGVQAQLQSRPVSVQIDAVVGSVATTVIDYADQHDVDLIVLPPMSSS
jgi:nucleotide-binding universal stress UspA family protein